MSHQNSVVECPGCLAKFALYPDFDKTLQDWFFSQRAIDTTFHCADAGRGRIEQETDFSRGASKAHYGQSAHNFNAAFDGFFQINGQYRVDKPLFAKVAANLLENIIWYGAPDAAFPETPHFELKNWRQLLESGQLKLVE